MRDFYFLYLDNVLPIFDDVHPASASSTPLTLIDLAGNSNGELELILK